MFTMEVRINGTMICHIYGRNINHTNGKYSGDTDKYSYELYQVESKKIRKGTVFHNRSKGILVLLKKIIEKVE